MKYVQRILVPFFSMALLMTLYQVGKYHLLKGEYTIWQSHIMTIMFTSLLATIISLFTMNWTARIERRRKELDLREARLETLEATMYTVHHIVNNFLNRLQLIRLETAENGKLSESTIEKLEADIVEVSRQMVELGEIKEPEDPAAFSKFFPQKTLSNHLVDHDLK